MGDRGRGSDPVETVMEVAKERPLSEKWLLAPNLRAGHQWLESAARRGVPVAGFHVKTMRGLAAEIALHALLESGLRVASRLELQIIADNIFKEISLSPGAYFRRGPNPRISHAVFETLEELRLWGVRPADIDVSAQGLLPKIRQIRDMLAEYERVLDERGIADYARVLSSAAEAVEKGKAEFPDGLLIIVPVDLCVALQRLEKNLLESFPPHMKVADEPFLDGGDAANPGESADLFDWVGDPEGVPGIIAEGRVEITAGVGEVNEVRAVLRKALEESIPFDDIEILYTDPTTYLPLIIETLLSVFAGGFDELPATFDEGIPLVYSRPGRALLSLLSWVGEGYPRDGFSSMIRDGLIVLPDGFNGAYRRAKVASCIRSLRFGFGKEHYIPVLERAVEAARAGRESSCEDEDVPVEEKCPSTEEGKAELLEAALRAAGSMLSVGESIERGGLEMIDGLRRFLDGVCVSRNELDNYARKYVLDRLEEAQYAVDGGFELPDNFAVWVKEFVLSGRVLGEGPRPGKIYASSILRGGHSGRSHTFMLGFDDSRFPGRLSQDPVMLDAEKHRISLNLPDSRTRFYWKIAQFRLLMSRFVGHACFSYPTMDLIEDAELFPSRALLSIYRAVSGKKDAGYGELTRHVGDASSFVPKENEGRLTPAEAALPAILDTSSVEARKRICSRLFPNIERGYEAEAARESDVFTEFDGFVPAAGEDLDPTVDGGLVLSANMLQALGKCPLDFFFGYALGIRSPDEFEFEPSRWLTPPERGGLLHRVFTLFWEELLERGITKPREGDIRMLYDILQSEAGRLALEIVPQDEAVFRKELEALREDVKVFFSEEKGSGSVPVFLEVPVGLQGREGRGNLRRREPFPLELPSGERVLVRGRIDRVDRVGGSEVRYEVIDYKTGGAGDFRKGGAFNEGRRIQNYIYYELFDSLLKASGMGGTVERFTYYFPTEREKGERISWERSELAEGGKVLEQLVRMIKNGCFPFSTGESDAYYSDFREVYGDLKHLADCVKSKMGNPANSGLSPFAELRKKHKGRGKGE